MERSVRPESIHKEQKTPQVALLLHSGTSALKTSEVRERRREGVREGKKGRDREEGRERREGKRSEGEKGITRERREGENRNERWSRWRREKRHQ